MLRTFTLVCAIPCLACGGSQSSVGVDANVAEDQLAAVTPFVLGTTGCPMAHCSPHEDDYNAVLAPTSIASAWHDRSVIGSAIGLGCASNGSTAVCSVVNATGSPAIVAYDAGGRRRWDSKTLLDATASASAPMVDTEGGAIAADDKTVVRIDSSGKSYGNMRRRAESRLAPCRCRMASSCSRRRRKRA